MGDPELRPARGDSPPARRSSSSPRTRVIDSPSSDGAAEAAQLQGGPNLTHRGDPRLDTADFGEPNPGNLRVDYVIPSASMQVVGSGVFCPVAADPLARLNDAPDHRATWVDLGVG